MKRLLLLSPLFLAACGAHFDPCVTPCPEGTPPYLCDCQIDEGNDGPSVVAPPVTPEPEPPVEPEPETPKPPVKPDPKPEHPKPPKEHPKPEPKEEGDDC